MIANCIVHLLAALTLMDYPIPPDSVSSSDLETAFPPSNASLLVSSSRAKSEKTLDRAGSGTRTLEKERSKVPLFSLFSH
jgi:hypothetical protein